MIEEKAGWIVLFNIDGDTFYPSPAGGTTNKRMAIIHKTPKQATRWCNLNLNRRYWDTVAIEHVTLIYGKMMPVTLNEIEGSL